jgi:hypothetical protein
MAAGYRSILAYWLGGAGKSMEAPPPGGVGLLPNPEQLFMKSYDPGAGHLKLTFHGPASAQAGLGVLDAPQVLQRVLEVSNSSLRGVS